MTTAITIWLVNLVGVALYVQWAADGVARGVSPLWYVAGVPIVYVAIVAIVTACWFALAWFSRSRRPPDARIGVAGTIRLYVNEVRAIAVSGPRMALFRWLVPDPPPAPARAPALLLHGVMCNGGVWLGMRRYLSAKGIGPVYTLSYGPPLASIESFADQVAAKIDDILRATGAEKVAIVGHSMGGLVARAYLRRYGHDRVAAVMTLGTPHHGSAHAWLFPGVSLGQLRQGNDWLSGLNADEGELEGLRIVSMWSWHDSMVAPQTSCRLAGAENIELVGVGHNALLGDAQVYDLVARELMRVAHEAAPRQPRASAAVATSESPA